MDNLLPHLTLFTIRAYGLVVRAVLLTVPLDVDASDVDGSSFVVFIIDTTHCNIIRESVNFSLIHLVVRTGSCHICCVKLTRSQSATLWNGEFVKKLLLLTLLCLVVVLVLAPVALAQSSSASMSASSSASASASSTASASALPGSGGMNIGELSLLAGTVLVGSGVISLGILRKGMD
jgi:hypothetical protein